MREKAFSRKGFSVIETLIVISILTLIGFTISMFQKGIFSSTYFLQESLFAQQELRGALKKMTAEIRPAAPSNTGAYPIGIANPDQLLVYTDTNNDGLYERIRYFVDGEILKRGHIIPSGSPLTYNPGNETIQTLVTDLATSSIFSYYNNTYTGVEPPLTGTFDISDVRTIKISITVDRTPIQLPGPMTAQSTVFVRSLKDNF
jgi:hypothetical protein